MHGAPGGGACRNPRRRELSGQKRKDFWIGNAHHDLFGGIPPVEPPKPREDGLGLRLGAPHHPHLFGWDLERAPLPSIRIHRTEGIHVGSPLGRRMNQDFDGARPRGHEPPNDPRQFGKPEENEPQRLDAIAHPPLGEGGGPLRFSVLEPLGLEPSVHLTLNPGHGNPPGLVIVQKVSGGAGSCNLHKADALCPPKGVKLRQGSRQ